MGNILINGSLELRPLERGDAADIFRIMDTQREYLGEWLPFVPKTTELADSQEFVDGAVRDASSGYSYTYTIRSNGELAGIIGFKEIDYINCRTEIGYWLSEPFQGQGLAVRSVEALLPFGFEALGMNRIQIKCAVGNTKSSRIPRKLGFEFEGIERDGELEASGEYADIEVYSLLRREFRR